MRQLTYYRGIACTESDSSKLTEKQSTNGRVSISIMWFTGAIWRQLLRWLFMASDGRICCRMERSWTVGYLTNVSMEMSFRKQYSIHQRLFLIQDVCISCYPALFESTHLYMFRFSLHFSIAFISHGVTWSPGPIASIPAASVFCQE